MTYLRKFYPLNKDLIEISIQGTKIKIVGFKHKEIKLRLTKLIEKLKKYRFPAHWDNILSMIDGS
jgi:hypothetical protein